LQLAFLVALFARQMLLNGIEAANEDKDTSAQVVAKKVPSSAFSGTNGQSTR